MMTQGSEINENLEEPTSGSDIEDIDEVTKDDSVQHLDAEAEEAQISMDEEILPTTTTPPEARSKRLIKSSIRWIFGLLIVFSLGFLSAVMLLYVPQRDEKSQILSNLAIAEEKVTSLENEINALEDQIENQKSKQTELESEVGELKEARKNTDIHLLILSTSSDINAARVALLTDDVANVSVHLSNTKDTLEKLIGLVNPEQVDNVTAMINRLTLVLDEMEDDPTTALHDLEVLANNLTTLENALFVRP
jgi:septal ring factor EnvC (AmiA/AmiB activator)